MAENNRVLLGMSGGVDSSVAAVLLKEYGYEVIGVTMKLFEGEYEGSCCNASSTLDAKRVCDSLGIPHYTLNFKEDFEKYVINDFICEYKKCRTPNPCIECNKYLKFGVMFKKALELDCNYIATGHYAKIEYDEKYGKKVLKKANNINKDQSYVLYNMPTYLLDHMLLPLGKYNSKDEIRKIAREHNLKVASKPDSQDICFIPDGNYKKFLENNSDIKEKQGNIVNSKGEILGTHSGLYKYTIGQRKGLGISNKVPLFVVGFNQKDNELIVGEEKELYKRELEVTDINLFLNHTIEKTLEVKAKIRYSKKEELATIYPIVENKMKVIFDQPQRAITPGQSIVFYDDDIVIRWWKNFINIFLVFLHYLLALLQSRLKYFLHQELRFHFD